MAINLRDKAQTRIIDGVTYEVWPLPHGVAQKILLKFLRAIGAAVDAASDSEGAQLAALVKALPDDDIEFIAAKFGDASAYEDGDKSVPLVKATHDLHFAGRFDVFLRWLLFAAEVNFSGFFDTERRRAIADDFKRITTSPTTE